MTLSHSLTLAAALALPMATQALAEAPDAGQQLFMQSCAGCHGESGSGGGEVADLLKIAPPDLTGLSARNDGTFPMLQVIHIIDGRTGLRAHGGPMPIFGAMYTASSGSGEDPYSATVEVRGRILSLAMYLESIQK